MEIRKKKWFCSSTYNDDKINLTLKLLYTFLDSSVWFQNHIKFVERI